jgi:hypothetical protein
MAASVYHRLAADLVLATHVSFVVFVVLGLVLVLVGGARGWSWVRNPWFRLGHVLAIGVVAAQAWLGVVCPLTALEMALRSRAGDAVYVGSFVAHWIETFLYYEAPPWVFAVCYTAFGLLVAASWFVVRPARRAACPRRRSRVPTPPDSGAGP